jgi:hypothetical protein
MKILISHQITPIMAAIEQAGLPALRGAFTIAALLFVLAGLLIFRGRHQLFDRDPAVLGDGREIRDDRILLIAMVWCGLTTLVLGVLIDVWCA